MAVRRPAPPSSRVPVPTHSGGTDAALIAAIKNAEQVAIAAGAPATTVVAAGAAAARQMRPSLSASAARGIASSAYNAILGQSGTTTFSQITQHPVGSFLSGSGLSNVGGWVGDLLRGVVPILKIGAGGLGLMVSGVALVYIAGRNLGAPKAGEAVKKAAGVVAPEYAAARKIAKVTRTTERGERARARVVTESTKRGGTRVRVSSKREGRAAQAAGAEYRSQAGSRSRDRLAVLRSEKARRSSAPRLHPEGARR